MLKENEYIRTDLGNILKYTGKEKEFIDKHLSISNKKDIEFLGTIVKHSKNIIDLIEVGDYVNGYPVKRIANFNNELCNFDLNTMEWTPLRDIDVYYNILTKEQYMQNCYTVERKKE